MLIDRRFDNSLAEIYAVQGGVDELRQVQCTADGRVRPELAAWLARQGSIDVAEIAADCGDEERRRGLALACAPRRHDWRRLVIKGRDLAIVAQKEGRR